MQPAPTSWRRAHAFGVRRRVSSRGSPLVARTPGMSLRDQLACESPSCRLSLVATFGSARRQQRPMLVFPLVLSPWHCGSYALTARACHSRELRTRSGSSVESRKACERGHLESDRAVSEALHDHFTAVPSTASAQPSEADEQFPNWFRKHFSTLRFLSSKAGQPSLTSQALHHFSTLYA